MAIALVIGATGHLGSAICRALVDAGWSVRALSRRPDASANLREVAVQWALGDGMVQNDVARAAAHVALVVDAAAPYPVDPFVRNAQTHDNIVDAAVERQRWLLEICAAQDAVFVGIGSFVSHRLQLGPDRHPLRRVMSTWLRGRHPYFAVKERTSALTIAAASRQRVVQLNPTGCLGPYDLKERRLALVPRLLDGEIPVSVTDEVDFIDVRDVGIAVVRAVETEMFGEAILLSGHSKPFDVIFADICAADGRRPPPIRARAALGLPSLIGLERSLGWLGQASPYPTLTLSIVLECGAVTRSEAQRELGVVPRPWAKTVADTIDWYRTIGQVHSKPGQRRA